MARKSLRPQFNQIRAWVAQGRTDAWIAHQLEVSTSELREFRRQHELAPGGDAENGASDDELRDEIEAEIEAAAAEDEAKRIADEAKQAEEDAKRAEERANAPESTESDDEDDEESDGNESEGRPRRRRRRGRRGGRGRKRSELEATFDHGDRDGYGLWLDPAVKDDPIYAEHWAGQSKVVVKIENDQIIITRAGEVPSSDGNGAGSADDASDDE